MSQNSPAEQATLRADISREVERIGNAISRHFEDLIANARWFTTLALAEVAGVLKFTSDAVGWKLGLVIVVLLVLGASIAFLIFAITLAHTQKTKMERNIVELLAIMPCVDLSHAASEDVADLMEVVKSFLKVTDPETEKMARFTVGLWLFLAASVLAGLAILVV